MILVNLSKKNIYTASGTLEPGKEFDFPEIEAQKLLKMYKNVKEKETSVEAKSLKNQLAEAKKEISDLVASKLLASRESDSVKTELANQTKIVTTQANVIAGLKLEIDKLSQENEELKKHTKKDAPAKQ